MKDSNVKQLTSFNIFKIIKDNPLLTRRELQRRTNLSWGTISLAVNEMIEKGVVVEKFLDVFQSGAHPKGLRVNTINHYIVGVNINDFGITCLVSDLSYSIIKCDFLSNNNFNKDDVLAHLYEMLDNIFSSYKKIYAICMSIQGPLDINKGISLDIPQIPGWKDIPIVDMLKKRYDVPTFIGHDPDCILSYQLFIDKENSEENCILIRIGNDIGISLMDKGKISLLSHDSSIEIGHAIMVPNGELCRCGKRGCYDMYCSFYGFRTKFEKLMGKKYGYDEMLDYISKSKNKDVQELLLNHEDNIALMLYNMMLMYNTKTFYIEGDILRVDKDFKAKLINKLSEYNEEIDAFFIDTDVSIPPLGAIIYSSDRWAQDAFYRAMYE